MIAAVAFAAALLAQQAASQSAQRGLAEVAPLQMQQDVVVRDAWGGDFDGDGRRDVAVSASVGVDGAGRAIFLWLARDAGGRTRFEAPLRLDLTPDVVAWAVGDVHADKGEEVVLLSATGVFAWRPRAPEEERFARLATCSFLWQLPDPEAAFLWPPAVRDLDGDGLPDLLLPEPGGYRIVLQRRGAQGATFERVSAPRVPPEPEESGLWLSSSGLRGRRSEREVSVTVSAGGGDREPGQRGTLLTVHESVPAPQLRDFDGDGRLDLIAQTTRQLHVWLQEQDGSFPRDPSSSHTLPVVADRERQLDASYSSHVLDLDQDGRSDCVFIASDKRSKDVRTQVLAFVQGTGRGDGAKTAEQPLFGPKGIPQDVLVVAGFVTAASFSDVDRDGLPDLVLRNVRPDLIDQLRSVSSESIEADVLVYRNLGGRFSRRPDLAWRATVPLKQFQVLAEFFADVSGDGLLDLLVRDAPERLRILMPRRQRETWTMVERPLWELAIHPDARVRFTAFPKGAEVLVIEPAQVLVVRFP